MNSGHVREDQRLTKTPKASWRVLGIMSELWHCFVYLSLARIKMRFPDASHRPKHRRTRHESPPANSDEEIESSTCIASDEHFVYQAGHKFFLLCAPWIRSGNDLFDTDIDEHYNAVEIFENDENKMQSQLKEIFDLLQEKFQQQALCQRWLRRQVSFIDILKIHTHLWLVYKWAQSSTIQ